VADHASGLLADFIQVSIRPAAGVRDGLEKPNPTKSNIGLYCIQTGFYGKLWLKKGYFVTLSSY
jgi:hypothetical protein